MADAGSEAVAAVGRYFGIVVAFLLPGFIAVWPLHHYSPVLMAWLCGDASNAGTCSAPSGGGFLLLALASLSAGMLISAARWAILDHIHEWTGLKRPNLDYSQLGKNLAAFETANAEHYRYYQYYANSQVALALWLTLMLKAEAIEAGAATWLLFSVVQALLFFAGRDALAKTDEKLSLILGVVADSTTAGHNQVGGDHDQRRSEEEGGQEGSGKETG